MKQSLSYLSLDWPLLSPLCCGGVAVTRSALFHPSSTSKGKKEREAVTFPSHGKP